MQLNSCFIQQYQKKKQEVQQSKSKQLTGTILLGFPRKFTFSRKTLQKKLQNGKDPFLKSDPARVAVKVDVGRSYLQ